jgi:hypothetical protein
MGQMERPIAPLMKGFRGSNAINADYKGKLRSMPGKPMPFRSVANPLSRSTSPSRSRHPLES